MNPQKPYYAVIFTSLRTPGDEGYAQMAEEMETLARKQPGFLDVESARDDVGITVSYWERLPIGRPNWTTNKRKNKADCNGILGIKSGYAVWNGNTNSIQ